MLMIGSPGAGKTMLARRLPTILPSLTPPESLSTTRIYSALGRLKADEPLLATRPFRSPHHTISDAGMVGGGSVPAPGEISLAHHGVLFPDELPEFNRRSLEVLRQPLEEGHVTISRALHSSPFPASFILVAAMNPCPCGHFLLSSAQARRSGPHASARTRRSRPALFAARRLRGNGARLARRNCREASLSQRNPSARRSPGWRGAGRSRPGPSRLAELGWVQSPASALRVRPSGRSVSAAPSQTESRP